MDVLQLNWSAFGEREVIKGTVCPSVCSSIGLSVQRGHMPSVIYLSCYISVPGALGSCDCPDCVFPRATSPRAGRMSDSATHSHGTRFLCCTNIMCLSQHTYQCHNTLTIVCHNILTIVTTHHCHNTLTIVTTHLPLSLHTYHYHNTLTIVTTHLPLSQYQQGVFSIYVLVNAVTFCNTCWFLFDFIWCMYSC